MPMERVSVRLGEIAVALSLANGYLRRMRHEGFCRNNWYCTRRGVLLLLLLFCCPVFGARPARASLADLDTQAHVVSNPGKPVLVGGNRGYPPYEFIDASGEPAGFTVDLVKAIAEVMGMRIQIRLDEWDKVYGDLVDGRIDMTLGMSWSDARDRIFDFPSPHTIVQHAIFAREDTPPVGSLEELRGKKVIVHRNGIMHQRLSQLGFDRELVLVDTPASGLRLLAAGSNDYAVAALVPGMYTIRENKLSNLVPVVRNAASYTFSFAVRQGDAQLLAQLNEGLAILKKTGQYQQIYDKWLGVLEQPRVPWEKIVKLGVILFLLLLFLLAGSIVWSRTLKRKVDQRTAELAREIEEKNKALEELRLHQDQLIQADKMASLGVLVSGVAHEINNPNGLILMSMPLVIDSYAAAEEILEEHYREHGEFMMGKLPYSRLREKLPYLLSEMNEGAKRIKRIVEALKDFARKGNPASMEPADFNELVQTAVRLVESSIRKSTNRFEASYEEGLPKIRGNAQRIEQVVVNLILNSCQALPNRESRISLATFFDQKRQAIVLQLSDEGVGIALENLRRLADPFFTTKRDKGGTGLGLSITAGIVKEHGGTLNFDSIENYGTTVTLTLPAMKEKA